MEQLDMTTATMRRLGQLLTQMVDLDCPISSIAGEIEGGCYARFNWATTHYYMTVSIDSDGDTWIVVESNTGILYQSDWNTDADLKEAVMVLKDDL